MEIGIVGSGIAGLTAAWTLSRAGHTVCLLESRSGIGMDSHAVGIPGSDRPLRADIPSRMFNRAQWPGLCQVYDQIGVESEPVNTSQSFRIDGGQPWIKTRGSWQPGWNTALLTNRIARRVARDVRRLMTRGRIHLSNGIEPDTTLGQYLATNRYSDEFVRDFLYPTLSSTVCTCTYEALDRYPAVVLLETLRNLTGDSPLMRARKGTSDVAERMAAGIDEIMLNTTVKSVYQLGQRVHLEIADGRAKEMDHVIVATQANQALQLLKRPTNDEQTILASIQYEPVHVVVHEDARHLPAERKDWQTFNMLSNRARTAAACSVWLNQFQQDLSSCQKDLFQTIWAGEQYDQEFAAGTVLARFDFQRPTVSRDSTRAISQLQKVHAELPRRIWFCGAWASAGTPLLESGVRSAQDVADLILANTKTIAEPVVNSSKSVS